MNVTETFTYDLHLKRSLVNMFGHDDRFEIHQTDPGSYEKDAMRKTITQYAIYMNDNGMLKAWYIFCQSNYVKTTATHGSIPLKRTQLSSLRLIKFEPSGIDILAYKHINGVADINDFMQEVEKVVLS